MNQVTKLALLVGATNAATCTTSFFGCGEIYSDSACTTKVAQTASQALTNPAAWWTGKPITCTADGANSKLADCTGSAYTVNLYTGVTDCSNTGAAIAADAVTAATTCATYISYTPTGGTATQYYIKMQTLAASCTSGAVGTGTACTASFFNCGQQYSDTACTAANVQTLTQAASEASIPADLFVECTPDAANAGQQDTSLHRWYKGNCAAASGTGTAAVAATWTKVVYSDSTCLTTAAPYVADTIVDGTCYTGATYVGASATTSVKYNLLAATCAYVSPTTYTACPVLQNFFTCSNKFNAATCATGEEVAQTSAQSNYTAQTYNEAMINTCTAAAANAVATTAVSAYRWENGECDATTGYTLRTFLDSSCIYADPAVTGTAVAPGGCIQQPGSTTEWVKYYIAEASCTFTEAQDYGAKPFMMAASAAMVAAAAMF